MSCGWYVGVRTLVVALSQKGGMRYTFVSAAIRPESAKATDSVANRASCNEHLFCPRLWRDCGTSMARLARKRLKHSMRTRIRCARHGRAYRTIRMQGENDNRGVRG